MDYMREIFLYRGKIVFIEEDDLNQKENINKNHYVLRRCLLFCLTCFFKCSVYET